MEFNIELFKKSSDYNNCLLKDTMACASMNNPDCATCEIGKAGEDTQKNALEDYEIIKALLPEGGVTPLMKSEICHFCVNEKPNPRAYYAIADYAHQEPQRTKASVIGIKVKTRVGSMIPVQIACCKKCRTNFLLRDYLPWGVLALVTLVMLLVLSSLPLRQSLTQINELLPLAIFAAVFAAGYALSRFVQMSFVKSKEKETLFEVNELPIIKRMLEKGWFSLFGDKRVKLVFSKKRLTRGWFSGDHVES